MIRRREERRTRIDIRQRGKIQIRKSVRFKRPALDNDLCARFDLLKMDFISTRHQAAKENIFTRSNRLRDDLITAREFRQRWPQRGIKDSSIFHRLPKLICEFR